MKTLAPLLAFLLALLLVGAAFAFGLLILDPALPNFDGMPLFLVLSCAFVLLCIVNRVGAVSYARRRFEMDAEGRNAFLNEERRVAAERDPDAALRELGHLAVLPVALLALYFVLILGMTVSFALANIDFDLKFAPLWIFWYLCFMPLVRRLQLMRGKLCREELVPADKMPHVRALAEKAARAAGVKGRVQLQLILENDITVKRVRRSYLVFLGTRALAVATEAELYAALLREFAYYADPRISRRLARYELLCGLGDARPRLGSWFFDLFFSPADVYMEWVMIHYKLAVSRKLEGMATALIRREGHATASLSMLAKEAMWDYFDHEWFLHLTESIHTHADTAAEYEFTVCDGFRKAMEERYGAWLGMARRMLPQAYYVGVSLEENARLLGLSLRDLPTPPAFPSPDTPLGCECIRPALDFPPAVEARYPRVRKDDYERHLGIIAAYEAGDRDLPAYELSPILNAYHALHRVRDVEALCDRILAEEPDFAHALYFKGNCRLYRYETTGIDDIYRAIDINKNYMQEGFALIETYCRLTGMEEEMNALLRRREAVVNAHAAEHDDAGSLHPTDRLVKETELNAELPAMLAYMAAAGNGCIERIYLVRKVISEDFFTSAFVIAFREDASGEDRETAYLTVFHYLDAADWQYSLFVLDRQTAEAVAKVPDSLVWERNQ